MMEDEERICRDCGRVIHEGGHSVAVPMDGGIVFEAMYCDVCARFRSAHEWLFNPRQLVELANEAANQ